MLLKLDDVAIDIFNEELQHPIAPPTANLGTMTLRTGFFGHRCYVRDLETEVPESSARGGHGRVMEEFEEGAVVGGEKHAVALAGIVAKLMRDLATEQVGVKGDGRVEIGCSETNMRQTLQHEQIPFLAVRGRPAGRSATWV